MTELVLGGMSLRIVTALVDGVPSAAEIAHDSDGGGHRLTVATPGEGLLASIGLRFEIEGAARYLRNGYHSWDGSWWTDVGTCDAGEPEGKQPSIGFAMTALKAAGADSAVVIGFDRHDRCQTRFRFGGSAERMTMDVETLLDGTGARAGETLYIFADADGDEAIRRWARLTAAASPLAPRIPARRITGWCSWYNHYAMIDDATIRGEIASCREFRDGQDVSLDVFLIDDGFTPEMGDWHDYRPQFPDGIEPLVGEAAAAGFTPGLWIAPFLVGNRSKLALAHPEWLVGDRTTGAPHVAMHFYGEFRWHKRSEEYHLLDVTHPGAADYIAEVFRLWRSWGVGYFKTDFMYYPMEYGPERLIHYESGLSRVAMWRRMAELIREAIGEALWLGCGCPLWASVGLVDAVRIGRDIGVAWKGDNSGETLLRDLGSRRLPNDILWQVDPDCILLRDRYHEMTDDQVEMLARSAAAAEGVVMTSDTLGDLSLNRRALFAELLRSARTETA